MRDLCYDNSIGFQSQDSLYLRVLELGTLGHIVVTAIKSLMAIACLFLTCYKDREAVRPERKRQAISDHKRRSLLLSLARASVSRPVTAKRR